MSVFRYALNGKESRIKWLRTETHQSRSDNRIDKI